MDIILESILYKISLAEVSYIDTAGTVYLSSILQVLFI